MRAQNGPNYKTPSNQCKITLNVVLVGLVCFEAAVGVIKLVVRLALLGGKHSLHYTPMLAWSLHRAGEVTFHKILVLTIVNINRYIYN